MPENQSTNNPSSAESSNSKKRMIVLFLLGLLFVAVGFLLYHLSLQPTKAPEPTTNQQELLPITVIHEPAPVIADSHESHVEASLANNISLPPRT